MTNMGFTYLSYHCKNQCPPSASISVFAKTPPFRTTANLVFVSTNKRLVFETLPNTLCTVWLWNPLRQLILELNYNTYHMFHQKHHLLNDEYVIIMDPPSPSITQQNKKN